MHISIVKDMDRAIGVIHRVGEQLEKSGKNPSKWWKPKNLNRKFLLQYAKPEEFFVALANGKSAAAAILQLSQNAQDWKNIDKDNPQKALYIHWLCVVREFAGQGLSKKMIDFAKEYARKSMVRLLRVDTNADEKKLRKLYEDLGFVLAGEDQEDYRKTAFYEMKI